MAGISRAQMISEITEVCTHDLRALLFWANIGMAKSRGGQYSQDLDHILESYAVAIKFKLPYRAKFGVAIRRAGDTPTEAKHG